MVAVKVPKGFCLAKNMTLRDYFAAAALQGILADTELRDSPDGWASSSYKMADAMIAERNKRDAQD